MISPFHFMHVAAFLIAGTLVSGIPLASAQNHETSTIPETRELTIEGDIASRLVSGVDRFLLKKLKESVKARKQHWSRDFSSAEAYEKSIQVNRTKLAGLLGLKDQRVAFTHPKYDLCMILQRPARLGPSEIVDNVIHGTANLGRQHKRRSTGMAL